MRRLRKAFFLAEEMGGNLGIGEVLLGKMPAAKRRSCFHPRKFLIAHPQDIYGARSFAALNFPYF